ncbi:MAG: hypothetical protein HYR71_02855, partial [Chloroflexi bacterium]|nr:hypothetical protein [Chloroflexota bacterium]
MEVTRRRSAPTTLTAGLSPNSKKNTPYSPPELAARAGHLPHERTVVLLPLALARTQDDMGRVRWTLFGGSEQGPERAFWKSSFTAPDQEQSTHESLLFIYRLLASAYGEHVKNTHQLRAAGFRILPSVRDDQFPDWHVAVLPQWTQSFLLHDEASFDDVRYLLTFRPFSRLPADARARYLAGHLHLLPFPGSLAFWGAPTYRKLQLQLPLAMQIPLLRLAGRRGGPDGIRVPQSGWLHDPHPSIKPSDVQPELVANHYWRTHRWNRVHRYDDELVLSPRVDHVTKVLFSTDLDVLGLYNKPMARNAQLWTNDFELLLDGPRASRAQIERAEAALVAGGLFGYRFHFPAMRVGAHEVYWHRPLVAYVSPRSQKIEVLPDAPLGYLTAYRADAPDLSQPVELWPRCLRREPYLSGL